MDRRLIAANGRVAHSSLRGKVKAERFTDGEQKSVCVPVLDLWQGPDCAARERQLLLGEAFLALETIDAMAFGYGEKDGHVGYVRADGLSDPIVPSHTVAVPISQLFPAPRVQSVAVATLSFGTALVVEGLDGPFARLENGLYVPAAHLRPIGQYFSDPVEVARLFLGVPYVWGGNTGWGLDCSGLVQIAHRACGIDCASDSDLQERSLGHPVALNDDVFKGDLFFWKGHVAMAADAETLIHANAYTMSVATEDLADAVKRIPEPLRTRRRV